MDQTFELPGGMKDLILDECKTKRKLQTVISDCFKHWGYDEVMTPSIEYYSTYNLGFNGLVEEEAYKFFDSNGKILMLRADMTVPIARVAATKFQNSPLPLRFSYQANVYTAHKNLKGMQDEVTDCGVELIGSDETMGELEILVTAMEVLKVLGDKKVVFEIGNVNYFQKACELLNITGKEYITLSKLIDMKSLKELDDYLKEIGLEKKYQEFFNQLPWLGGDESILEEAKKSAFDNELVKIIERMQGLNELLKQLGYKDINYDLGKTSKINYYTGLIFEAFIEGVGTRILSGGSYNNLLGKFGRELNATGFSIKIDSLLEAIESDNQEKVLTLRYPSSKVIEAFNQAKELRKNHIVKLKLDNSLTELEVE